MRATRGFSSPGQRVRLPHLHSRLRDLLAELLQLRVELGHQGEQRIRVPPEHYSVPGPLQLPPEEPPSLISLGDKPLRPSPSLPVRPLSLTHGARPCWAALDEVIAVVDPG